MIDIDWLNKYLGFPIIILGLFFQYKQTTRGMLPDEKKEIDKQTMSILFLLIIYFSYPSFSNYIESMSFNRHNSSVSNILTCLGNTGGEQRHGQLSECLKGVSLPTTTTAEQILDILGTIPIYSDARLNALVELFQDNKITISGGDATKLSSAFGADKKRFLLTKISCHIERPIPDSVKNELLTGIDPIWQVRQELEKYPTPPCKN